MCVASGAYAQVWDSYVNRENFFSVNLPNEPTATEAPYKTAKGTALTARTFASTAPAGTIFAGTFSITVVDYTNNKDEINTAMDEASKTIRAMGAVKYEGVNMLDNHRSWRMTVETADGHRILAEILVAANNRLYISKADTPLNAASPAQFQASLQILDANGLRIRNRQVQPISADEVVPVTPQQRAIDAKRIGDTSAGTWKVAGGSCDAPYLKAPRTQTKTVRGEDSIEATVTNQGMTVSGQMIIQGPRVGQLINPMTDKVILIFDPLDGGKMNISALGPPALGWPDVQLELCSGTSNG
jgi:hypothetical protein